MSDIAIRVENLGKLYRIGERESYKTLREAITNAVVAPLHWLNKNSNSKDRNPDSNYIWALKDVSFEVRRGEAVGIIGPNGAGKSTLLKIITRITPPSEGYAEIRGRVGSLLEVGTGFHPELTGRENIYLYGSILGMRKAEIDRKFEQIVEFSEVEKFIDTPLKRYSSGMQVRLAFSVAAHLEPEILLVDEVLAVGDLAFQAKCLAHMKNFSRQGITVLFVSHNLLAISDLCKRALLVSNGSIIMDDSVDAVVNSYRQIVACSKVKTISQSEYLRLISLRINGKEVGPMVTYTPNRAMIFELEVDVIKTIYNAILNLVVELPDGRYVLHLRSDVSGVIFNLPVGRQLLSVKVSDFPLSPGPYLFWFRMVSVNAESSLIWDTEKIILNIEGVNPLNGIICPEHFFQHCLIK